MTVFLRVLIYRFLNHLLTLAQMLESFSYGEEFLRLNFEALEAYSACRESVDVARCQEGFHAAAEAKKTLKEERLAREREQDVGSNNIGGYMDDMDLPPIDSDAESYEYEEECAIDEVNSTALEADISEVLPYSSAELGT